MSSILNFFFEQSVKFRTTVILLLLQWIFQDEYFDFDETFRNLGEQIAV